MEALILTLILVIVAFLLVWCVDQLGLAHPFGTIIKVLIVLILVVYLLSRLGIV